jgi:HPt (histidine-containing phosphotransfer) domain-containing protein
MKRLTANAEFDAAGKLAHKLKSSLATLGFNSISEMMKDLEHYSKTSVDPATFETKMENLEMALEELFAFIRHSLASDLV